MDNSNIQTDGQDSLVTPEDLAHFRAQGKMPDLVRGQMVYVHFDGAWRVGMAVRRVPGDVFWVELSPPVAGFRRVIVSLANYGGRVR